jgi:16S rRNA (cytidine1402-2'-O)-methyltransferase
MELKANKKPKIYLIPSPLDEEFSVQQIASEVAPAVAHLRHFAVEEIRHARRYLRKLLPDLVIDDCTFYIVNKRTSTSELQPILKVLQSGISVGMISEAGLPGIADPGAHVAALAHKNNFSVKPLVGPSSIFMALMASGFNGQSFTFHGYLPKERPQRLSKIKDLENLLNSTGYTQLFMETPFRNHHLLEDILATCHPDTLLCIAASITTDQELIRTQSIAVWKKSPPDLKKKPAIFVFGKF